MLLLACCAALPVLAQVPTPGTVLDTVPGRKPAPPPTPPEVIFPAPRLDAGHDPNAPRFTVNSFTFVGNTAYAERRLQRLLEVFIDLQLNLFDLDRAADIITRYYRDNGYPIARAIVPAQKVEKGIVRIEVIEGRIGRISVAGNNRYSPKLILSRTLSLPKEEIVTLERLERSLLLMNDLPGLSARATLAPGAEFGTTDVVVRVEEKPVAGFVNLDNRGRKETGQWRLDGNLDINNPLAIGDQLNIRLIESQNGLLRFARVGYSVPVFAEGMRLGVNYSRVDYTIGGDFAALGIEGEVTNAEALLSYPFVRSRRSNLVFGVGFRHTSSRQTTLGVQTQDNNIDLLNLNLLGNWVHEDSAVTNALVQLSGNGKKNPFGARQDAQFAKLEFDVNHLRAASKTWDLFLRGNLVVSRDALADTEKFSLGGADSVRGYAPSDLRGDNGWLAVAELRRQFVVFNVVGVFSVFYDAGLVHVKGFSGNDSIRSAGVGVSLFPTPNLRVRIDYAHRLSDRLPSDRTDNRLWVTVGGSF